MTARVASLEGPEHRAIDIALPVDAGIVDQGAQAYV